MKLSDKIVIHVPVSILWTDNNLLPSTRLHYLTVADIKETLRTNTVQFVVADVGHKLQWIDELHRFIFWKNEVLKHLVNNTATIELDNFPNGYVYIASLWTGSGANSIILLEKLH